MQQIQEYREQMKQKQYTKEELIRYLQNRRAELGKRPTRKDVPEDIKAEIKRVFGKWCYGLEESGLIKPSAAALKRRAARAEKWRRVHAKRRALGKQEKDPEER